MGDLVLSAAAVPPSVLVVAVSFIIALCAQIAIALPFTPVPLSGSTLGVLLAGALLGSRRGPMAVALYLAEGAAGLPFFAGGAAGFIHFAGPTGGYLIGFLPAAYVAGRLAEAGWDKTPFKAFMMMIAGSAVILAMGLLGLARFVSAAHLLPMGLYPFLPGDAAKACIAAALLPGGWALLGAGAPGRRP
ncbi:MAG: biotin transporter BioY [Elusimicrobia bacterium]|nr:biotin transporter BioY [Elusimicrobiota bacterium]